MIISWLKLLYKYPMSSVHTNNIFQYFLLQHGTRPGCPMSTLLFVIAIEPLAASLRSSPEIRSILRSEKEHKLSLCADDLWLYNIYVSDPQNSLSHIMATLDRFTKLSGYKINVSKSELFPVNSAAQSLSFNSYPFNVTTDKFTYLGIVVTEKSETSLNLILLLF